MKLYFLIVSVFLIIWEQVDARYLYSSSSNLTETYRLPTSVVPVHYDIELKTYLPGYGWKEDDRSESFEGSIIIKVEVQETTDRIVLHSDSLQIHSQRIQSADEDVQISNIELIPKLQFLVLNLNKPLQSGENASVYIEFSGHLRRDRKGFYVSGSDNSEAGQPEKINAITQFETTAARFMIPCFDEPAFKATWQVELTYPKGATALTNTIDEWTEENSDEWVTTGFKETVKMSSYLLAVFIGDVKFKETTTERGIRIRVYAPPANIDEIDHALNVSKFAVDGFERLFNINFPMEKIDFVAVREFDGAMENWGLIVHDYAFIFGKNQQVSIVVIHELAHQWFGNLVTMDFWHNVWLNEAFASYMEAVGLGFLDNDFDSDFHHTNHYQEEGLQTDTSYKIRELNRENNGNIDIAQIVYSKGSSFLRMIEKIIGTENFNNALRWYLSEYQYKNTNEKHLYAAFEKFMSPDLLGPNGTRLDIGQFAKCWTDQVGHPTIYVERTPLNTFRLRQQYDKMPHSIREREPVCGYRWDVPIWYQRAGRSDVQMVWLGRDKFSIILEASDLVLLNANSNGFYEVSYLDNNLSVPDILGNDTVLSNSSKKRMLLDAQSNAIASAKIAEYFIEDSNQLIRKYAMQTLFYQKGNIDFIIIRHEDASKHIQEVLSNRTSSNSKTFADCKATEHFNKCLTWLTSSDNIDKNTLCLNEKLKEGRSKARLLNYLKSESDRDNRDLIIQFIGCSDTESYKEVLKNKQYNLSVKERKFVKELFTKNGFIGSIGRSSISSKRTI